MSSPFKIIAAGTEVMGRLGYFYLARYGRQMITGAVAVVANGVFKTFKTEFAIQKVRLLAAENRACSAEKAFQGLKKQFDAQQEQLEEALLKVRALEVALSVLISPSNPIDGVTLQKT